MCKKTRENVHFLFLNYHFNNFLAHLLYHVTYVTSLRKCSDPGVKLADL